MRTRKLQLLDNAQRMVALCLFLLFPASSPAAGPPAAITVQPLDQNVINGGTAMFTVVATSGTALSYQWYEDGWLFLNKRLTGQTSSTLTLTNVGNSDEGQYFVEVINGGGIVYSRKATLTVYTAPVANNDTYTTLEDAALTVPAAGVLGNDTDADGAVLAAVLVSNVTQGSLSLGTNGGFIYTPNTNHNGSDSFTYRATDRLNPVVAILQQNNVGGGNTLVRDNDMGAQSFKHGTAGDPDYMIDRIVLYPSRRSGGSGNLNLSIGTARNGGSIAGSAFAISASSITNTSQGVSFQTYAIAYGAPLGPFTAGTTYYLNLDNQTGERVYLEYPNANTYAGGTYYDDGNNQNKDIRFQVLGARSALATVTINVTPVNDRPLAANDSTNVLEDASVTIKALANDYNPDGRPLTITSTFTTNGTAVVSGTNVIFRASTNFNGTAVFSYTMSDGANSATGSVTVTVTPLNDAPVASHDIYTTLEDIPLIVPPSAGILTNDTDADGDVLTAALVSNVSNGSLSLNPNGSFTYTPGTSYNGSDSFTYRAHDGTITGNVATVTIDITPVNDPPLAVNDSTNTLEDVSVTIKVLANDFDVDGTPLMLMGTSTTNGTAILSGTNIVFTPSTNFNGVAVISYTVSDGADSATGSVTVTVTAVNDAPMVHDDTYTTLEDVPLIVPADGILTNDVDVDGDVLTAALVSNVSNGSLSLNPNGSFTYTPDTNYNGTDSFTYRASDGAYPILQENTSGGNGIDVQQGQKGAQTFRHGSAGAPDYTISKVMLYLSREATAPNENLNFTIGTGRNSGTIAGSSVAINPLSITNTSSGASFQRYEIVYATPVGPLAAGTTYYLNLECEAGNGRNMYTEYSGSSTYANGTYYDDGNNTGRDMKFAICESPVSATTTVTINVTVVNDPPFANDDSTNTLEDVSVTIPVLANDSDVEGTPLTITSTSTTNGTASISGTNVVLTPSTNFNGTIVFSYTVSDGTNSAIAYVTVAVTPVNDTPLSLDSPGMMADGFTFQFSVGSASTYVVQASTNLTDWTSISTNSTLTGQVTFTDTTATNHPRRFYRVMAP